MNGVPPKHEGGPARRRRLTTILSADVCGYTGLSERDPDGALAAVSALTARIVAVAKARGGRLFHRAGDGFLVELPSATEGLGAARDIHSGLADTPIEAAGAPLAVRIGVHTGEAAEEADGDLLGHAVNVAARLQGEAPKGGTVVSGAARALAESAVPMRRMGELRLKNLREPVMAYEVLEAPGLAARLRASLRTRWVRRNAPAFALVGALVVLAAVIVAGSMVSRDRAMQAERAAEERAAQLAEDAARLSALLTADEERLLDREAVEEAALSLLSSTDPRKARARELALAGDTLGAARALRATYEAQAADGAGPGVLAETAVQAGAFAYRQDQQLALWAYQRANDIMPTDPFVLLRLSRIAMDRGAYDEARAVLTALLAVDPALTYKVQAEESLAYLTILDGNLDAALGQLRQAVAMARSARLSTVEAALWDKIGFVHISLATTAAEDERASHVEAADESLRRSLRIYRAVDDAEGVANVLGSLAKLSLFTEDFDESIDLTRRQLGILEDAGDIVGAASASLNLALYTHRGARFEERDRYIRKARTLAEEGDVGSVASRIDMAEASFAYADEDVARACRLIEASIDRAPDQQPVLETMMSELTPGLDCAFDAAE